jgi:PAS domain S-box-containing protein
MAGGRSWNSGRDTKASAPYRQNMPPALLDQLAQWGPPYFALGVLIWGLWKAGKWIGWRLFDDEKGLVVLWFRSQQKLFDQQAEAVSALATGLRNTTDMVESIQRRLDRAIASSRDASEQAHLIDILVDDMPVPMALVSEEGSFIRTNESLEDLLGYTKDELAGLRWQDITPHAADMAIDASASRSIAAGTMQRERIEKTYRRKDGATVYCALHIRRFPRTGPFRHFVSIVVPLSAERQLR